LKQKILTTNRALFRPEVVFPLLSFLLDPVNKPSRQKNCFRFSQFHFEISETEIVYFFKELSLLHRDSLMVLPIGAENLLQAQARF